MIQRLPFLLIPVRKALIISHRFLGIGSALKKIFPQINLDLKRAEFGLRADEYLAICFLSGILIFLWTTPLVGLMMVFLGKLTLKAGLISVGGGFSFGLLSFFYLTMYPKLKANRKTKALEKELLFALRHLLIQVRSGIPLYDSMVTIAKGGYGVISEEFEQVTKQIHGGTPVVEALDQMAVRNPSEYFRRAIWQISNAMKAGAEISDILSETVSDLSKEQRISIRKYGSELNPLALMYMMLTVILPALGITFLIILSSFAGIQTLVNEWFFGGILGLLVILQFMFLGLIKTKRPVVGI